MKVLEGKAAIVTGSARGIGRATAELLCAYGARVLVNDLDADLAAQAAAEIEGETAVFGGDLTQEGVCEALVERAVSEFGQLDIVVNNAGYTWDGIAHKMSDAQFRAMLEIHTVVPFRVLRAAAPYLREPAKKEREDGREVFRKVVNVTSISGTQGNVGQVNYSAAKAGLAGITEDARPRVGPVHGERERRRLRVRRDTTDRFVRRGRRDVHARGRRDSARHPRAEPRARMTGHPARTRCATGGGRRRDLLPLLAVVELRPGAGAHGERRPDDGDDVSFDLEAIGRPSDHHRYEVTDEALRKYAEAMDDVVGGPVFALLPVWRAAGQASRMVASDDVRPQVVHYEQDIVVHQPLVAGMRVRSRVTPVALLARPNGTSLVIRTETSTEDGELLNEQCVTEFFRGMEAPGSTGERAPDHRLAADGAPVAEISYPIAADQTVRYAAASGDHFAIHLDDEFARSVGLPGRIVHGLCTMAFTGRAVLQVAGVDHPGRLRRLAVRFSAPLFPGDTLTTRIWDLGGGAFGFEAVSGEGATVVKDGRAELRRT